MGDTLKNCKILILGGTCFIGPALIRRLAGADITCFHRGIHEQVSDPPLYKNIYGDRRNADDIRPLSAEFYDVIIDISATSPDMVEHSIPMLTGCCSRYVFISSSSIYDRALPCPHSERENPVTGSSDPYINAKLMAEEIIKNNCKNYTIIRPSKIYGPGNYYFKEQEFLDRIRKSSEIALNKDPILHFTYIDDLIEAICALINVNGTFNAAGKEPAHLSRFIKTIAQIHGLQVTFRHSDRSDIRFTDLSDCTLDLTAAHLASGWEPVTGIYEGLSKTFAPKRNDTLFF